MHLFMTSDQILAQHQEHRLIPHRCNKLVNSTRTMMIYIQSDWLCLSYAQRRQNRHVCISYMTSIISATSFCIPSIRLVSPANSVTYSDHLLSILNQMTQRDPTKRPSAEELLRSSYMQEVASRKGIDLSFITGPPSCPPPTPAQQDTRPQLPVGYTYIRTLTPGVSSASSVFLCQVDSSGSYCCVKQIIRPQFPFFFSTFCSNIISSFLSLFFFHSLLFPPSPPPHPSPHSALLLQITLNSCSSVPTLHLIYSALAAHVLMIRTLHCRLKWSISRMVHSEI